MNSLVDVEKCSSLIVFNYHNQLGHFKSKISILLLWIYDAKYLLLSCMKYTFALNCIQGKKKYWSIAGSSN